MTAAVAASNIGRNQRGLAMGTRQNEIPRYVIEHLHVDPAIGTAFDRADTVQRIEKALVILPEDVLDLFLSGYRNLVIRIGPDTGFPVGMSTRTEGSIHQRRYTIVIYPEHRDWPEDRFIGGFLRELGHVVARRPPETEWPLSRAERSRYREALECRADAVVWRWGLRHYSMAYLTATYPSHWVDRILDQIGKMLMQEH